jgi:hypothetical protein
MLRLKLLHTMPSSREGFPFQAGQVIEVTKLTAEFRRWIKDGAAVVLRDDPPETAVKRDPERAVHS